jgi:hypothetical protein
MTLYSLVEMYYHLADYTASIISVDIYKAGTPEKSEHFYQTTSLHILARNNGHNLNIFLVVIFTCSLLY